MVFLKRKERKVAGRVGWGVQASRGVGSEEKESKGYYLT